MEVTELPIVKTVTVDSQEALRRAMEIEPVDNESYLFCGEFNKVLKAKIDDIEEAFAEPKSTTNDAHKSVCDLENSLIEPIKAMITLNGKKLIRYQEQKEKERLEEERQAREKARAEIDEEKLAEAEELEKQGRHEEAEAVIEEHTPAVIVQPSSVPKVKGISMRQTWGYRILSESLVPPEWCCVDEKKISKVANATKGTIKIPGIEFFPIKSISTRTG